MSVLYKFFLALAAVIFTFIILGIFSQPRSQEGIFDFLRPPQGVMTKITDEFRLEAKDIVGFEHRANLFGMIPRLISEACGEELKEQGCVYVYPNGDCDIYLPFGLELEVEQALYIDRLIDCQDGFQRN